MDVGKKIKNVPSGEMITNVVKSLCVPDSYIPVAHRTNHDTPMPSIEVLSEIVEHLRDVIFPGYFGASELKPETMSYYVGANLDKIAHLLPEQIKRGFCFTCKISENPNCEDCEERAKKLANKFIKNLPEIRRLLSLDVRAAYEGDPAAFSPGETIFCYPSIKALTNFRIAHELYLLEVPLIPRIITEMAHSETGIDIHPGATIGESFFMDHGTGIVIGETCRIGNRVRVYQGVTLGAKSFPMDEHGNLLKGIQRHPVIEDEVIIYSGATILGNVNIGKGAVIGGNVWLTEDVPAGAKLLQRRPDDIRFENGSGI